MADPDQSLDQIIRSTKTYRGRGGKRGRGGYRGGRGRGRGGYRGGRGRGRGHRASSNRPPRSTPAKHDSYANGVGGGFQGGSSGGPNRGSTKLLVSNLHFDVTDDEIRELFEDIGHVRKVAVHYDETGKSRGSADVTFQRHVDAVKAVREYNGVPLDKRLMSVQIIDGSDGTKTSTATPNKMSIRARVGPIPTTPVSGSGGYGARGQGRGRGRGRGRRRGRGRGGTKEPVPSRDELDADLDTYRQTTNGD